MYGEKSLEQELAEKKAVKEAKLKELSGPEFMHDLNFIKMCLLRVESDLSRLQMQIKEGEIKVEDLEKLAKPEERGSREAASSRHEAGSTIGVINDICKRYKLNFKADLTIPATRIYAEIIKAWEAKLWEVSNDIERPGDLHDLEA